MQKLLYVTPHLSTGGAPQYLLKKIELLIHEYDIHVIEYQDLGIFRVQKDRIIELLKNPLIIASRVHTLWTTHHNPRANVPASISRTALAVRPRHASGTHAGRQMDGQVGG